MFACDQRRRGHRFVLKAGDVRGVAGQIVLQHFEGHLTTELLLLGQIDFGHRSATEPTQQLEIAERPTGQVGIIDGCGAAWR
ncbi:MAG: hypothetical protein QM775_31175 [Pirellulales bacterium]